MAGKRAATSRISKDLPEGESSPPPSDGEEEHTTRGAQHNASISGRKLSRPSRTFGGDSRTPVSHLSFLFFTNNLIHLTGRLGPALPHIPTTKPYIENQ